MPLYIRNLHTTADTADYQRSVDYQFSIMLKAIHYYYSKYNLKNVSSLNWVQRLNEKMKRHKYHHQYQLTE